MAKWRNTINLKDVLGDDEDDQAVLKVCEAAIPALEEIEKKEKGYLENRKPGDPKPVDEDIIDNLHQIIEEFKFIKGSIISGSNPDNFGHESWCEALNDQLTELYDLGDTSTMYKSFFDQEKFLFVA
ncbi:hypothetical protein D3C81_333780 [compost metagenome]